MKKFLAAAAAAIILFPNSSFAAEGVTLSLDEAIALALENNRLIEQSADDREAARWNLSSVRRQSGPQLSWSSLLNRIGGRYYNSRRETHYAAKYASRSEHVEMSYYPSYMSENYNSLSLTMPLYTGGRLENQREAARYNLNAADLSLENSRQRVKYQAAEAYYQVLQRASLVDVQEEAVNLLEEHLRFVTIQYEVGTVAKSDVLATNVQLANSQQNLNSAQGNYETAIAQLNNIIGLPVDTEVAASDKINFVKYNLDENECMEYALAHRPDGIAAVYEVKRTHAQTAATKSGYRPTVNAVVQGYMSGENVFGANHNNEQWALGVRVEWNIFDNGITSANVHQAKAAEHRAESLAQQQIETIQLEVHSAYIALKTAEKNIEVTAAAVDKAEEEFDIAQVRYVEGVDTNLNVMNAQEKVVETRNNYYAALYNYNTSRAQLERAMGVPVSIDALLYAEAEQAGKSSEKSLKEAAVENIYEELPKESAEPFNTFRS
ncbi:MAG: TolC family protein [Selenomonadaceae bacterium]|nr:TolC family protein [Selenomonadaceae bacterium]MBQ9497312.1 TolC family protein [Selenomonadaceae bacterium]